jgi:hypothetical protein
MSDTSRKRPFGEIELAFIVLTAIQHMIFNEIKLRENRGLKIGNKISGYLSSEFTFDRSRKFCLKKSIAHESKIDHISRWYEKTSSY